MNDSLELARFLPVLRGGRRTLRAAPRTDAEPIGDEVFVSARAPEHTHLGPHLRVTSFLRFPGTGGGHVLLDARNAAVFRAGARLLPRGRAWTRVASELVRATSRVGLHRRIAPGRLTFVERADAPGRALHERCTGLPAELAWNVASGVPGRDQKTIVQLVTPAGAALAYAKLAHTPSTRALVAHETHVLRRLAELRVNAPRLLGGGCEHGTAWLVQSGVAGARSPGRLHVPQRRFLADLAGATHATLRLADVPSVRASFERLAALTPRAEPGWCELFGALARALADAGDQRVPCALAHGDFTPWNVVVDGASACAFDWEHARELAPAGHDALHFTLQQAVLVERIAPARLFAHTAELEPEGVFAVDGLLCAAYLLDSATHDEMIQLEQRSPFAQVDWLRDARCELARALLARGFARRERAA